MTGIPSYSVGAFTHHGLEIGFETPDRGEAVKRFADLRDDLKIASVELFEWRDGDATCIDSFQRMAPLTCERCGASGAEEIESMGYSVALCESCAAAAIAGGEIVNW